MDVDIVVVGSVNLDQVIEVASLPVPGETVRGGPIIRLGGGKGANQAVAAARLGRSVALVGAVGTDADSAELRRELAAEGVDVSRLAAFEGPPGQAVVLVDRRAENCVVVSPGANAELGAAAVQEARDLLAAAAVVVAQLEIPLPAVLAAARAARGRFVLNPAPAPAPAPAPEPVVGAGAGTAAGAGAGTAAGAGEGRGGSGLPDELWPLVDVLVPNRTELARLCGVPDSAVRDAADVARLAAGLPCARVVVTLGAEGALVRDGEVSELVAAPVVRAVDTTGAGDTFCGALAVALAEGRSLIEAARFAVRAAALSVERTGARTAMPTRERMRAALPPRDGRPLRDGTPPALPSPALPSPELPSPELPSPERGGR
ncbi:ribokinase [Kitasatospora sp. NBC_01287]|uniref:ribokinase n=1 Tax=Kitasatospora sp. NBC_01287 TaxID=2903573 RepID=UPI00225BB0BC|nr:ribokinase [Kitasatospora sp. NBC_01287]MCX4745991.1 ribokinase [Kitasatospora sp. NBC_01287]